MTVLSASQFSEICNVSTSLLRDWRRRGLVDGLGTLSDGGHWQYGFADILRMLIAREYLAINLLPGISEALNFAQKILPWVSTAILEEQEWSLFSHHYLAAQGQFDVFADGFDMHVSPIENIANLPATLKNSPAHSHMIIDVEKLALEIASRLSPAFLNILKKENRFSPTSPNISHKENI